MAGMCGVLRFVFLLRYDDNKSGRRNVVFCLFGRFLRLIGSSERQKEKQKKNGVTSGPYRLFTENG
ncbi:MAG: hypothetical protein IKV90_00875 [Clostridia bacterium]|nr:hypothetical protein [Clostridia bacterium]